MPAASHSPIGTASEGSILLIEEYDALAAAISSALRKFAPGHPVHVARTLAEANTLAETIEPALLVIDFDPPFTGLSSFLQKMQATQPDTRALLLAGKLPPEIAKLSRYVEAIQFVEKPFDVPDFGAAIQALLGPWREPGTAVSRGTLHDLTLADLIVIQCAGGRTVALEITDASGKSGEIHLRHGAPSHAETGRKSGTEAIREMLEWQEVQVQEREKVRPTGRTVQPDWTDALLESLRQLRARPVRQPGKTKSAPAPKAGKKLVVVDDTEMLLIFVEDVLCSSGDFQITTAINGINGVKEIQRAKPDLVLLDYSLPDINGDEVCRRLLQDDATSRIPVLMMSGHVPEMAKAAATLDNVVATIEKPFLSDALVSLVQQVLTEGRRVRKKASPGRRSTSPPPPATTPAEITAGPAPGGQASLIEDELPLEIESRQAAPVAPAGRAPALHPPESEMATPVESVVEKARRAIGHLRRHITPKEETAATTAAPESTTKPPAARPGFGSPEGMIATRALSEGPNEVVLSLFLEVVSVQITPDLRMGAIRAKPSSAEVSLHVMSPDARGNLPQTGFKLGPVGLDGKGRIATMRLVPSHAPVRATPTQNALQIGAVSVVPIDSTSRMQLTPAPEASMTLQLVARLELTGVELSPTFQVSQIVLKDRGGPTRVMISSQTIGEEENGTVCETVAVRLDHSAHIAELLLSPVT